MPYTPPAPANPEIDPDEAPSGTVKKNRANPISVCRKEWPYVKPKEQRLDCDEFPFASTKEGSLSANGNFSVRYIDASDNRSSGSQLGVFCQQTRRLGNDPFWVYSNPIPDDRDEPPVR
ncbi:NucA/NucB deoxyribonuclease domain-containing protein [Herbidospora yilanensis]|uniref:NucA/NucB deoxyribonuclease domain-containing protein n=1 Tax=Herbidospora yilanensis TaxID=354426 RepID=UPI0007818F1C|nr:NucA/NucB deoxyribonuclease domain-containing protein [Herbidospora yilanensis]